MTFYFSCIYLFLTQWPLVQQLAPVQHMTAACRMDHHPQLLILMSHIHIIVVGMMMTRRLMMKPCKKKSVVWGRSMLHICCPVLCKLCFTAQGKFGFNFLSLLRHMMEIQALQARQKEEIEGLFTRMGKTPPPSVLSPAVAMPGGRRRLKSKSHKSARSSGQPSPVHSGNMIHNLFLVMRPLTYSKKEKTVFSCLNIDCNLYCDLQLRAKVQSLLQSKVQPQ